MRKYVLTDAQGVTANGKLIVVGKVTHAVGAPNDVYSQIAKLCADSALLAVLQSPSNNPNLGQRLFQIDQWEVSVTGDRPRVYTVVKEAALPEIIPEQKLVFAIQALAEVYRDPMYLKWSNDWLSGADRGTPAAHAIEQAALKEIEAADALEVLEAHGDISQADLQITEEKANHARRVIAVARAVQLVAAGDSASLSEATKLVAQATVGLSHDGKRLDLSAVAERVVSATAHPKARASM
jgi:hypothetical protein